MGHANPPNANKRKFHHTTLRRLTQHQVTHQRNAKELLRLSIVSGLEGRDVIIDSLVAPSMPVVDFVTRIHGIKEAHVQQVTFTHRHAQAVLAQLCTANTILVGHALENDLKSLKVFHRKVVDTALVFHSEHGGLCSLRDLSLTVLKEKQPEPHDSISDARISLRCAEKALGGHDLPLVPRLGKNGGGSKSVPNKACALMVHRLPAGVTAEQVQALFLATTYVQTTKVDTLRPSANDNTSKTTVHFATKAHCDLAFASLPGNVSRRGV